MRPNADRDTGLRDLGGLFEWKRAHIGFGRPSKVLLFEQLQSHRRVLYKSLCKTVFEDASSNI